MSGEQRGGVIARAAKLIVCAALLISVAPAGAATANPAIPLPPIGFRMPASNGYKLAVVDYGEVTYVNVYKTNQEVSYVVRNPKGADSEHFSIDLPGIAHIDMTFVPSGGVRQYVYDTCFHSLARTPRGTYVGTVSFMGELGYSSAEATEAASLVNVVSCSGGGYVTGGPGAELSLSQDRGDESVLLDVLKVRPKARAETYAQLFERHAGFMVYRYLFRRLDHGVFRYTIPPKRADLRLPAPFSGSATYRRDGRGKDHLQADLELSFPGHVPFHLGGRGLTSST